MLRGIRRMWQEGRRGAVTALVAVTGTVIVGMAALTFDLGNMYLARSELQRAADAAALAAVAKLTHYSAGTTENIARAEAKRIVEANPVLGKTVTIDTNVDVVFGYSVYDSSKGTYTFAAGGTIPSAVRVYIRMTADSPNGALKFMFGAGSKDLGVKAAAMLIPRDISVVADLSGSMNDDSELQNYKQTAINLWNIWVCLPTSAGKTGMGNGWDSPAQATDVDETGRASVTPTAGVLGPIWGQMNSWGTLTIDSSYNPASDPGLFYIPYGQTSTDTNLMAKLQAQGYNATEINAICSGSNDSSSYYPRRVEVALGLSRWDSGITSGMWKLHAASSSGNKDSKIDSSEVTALVSSYPWVGGSWSDYIYSYMRSTSSYMYGANSRLPVPIRAEDLRQLHAGELFRPYQHARFRNHAGGAGAGGERRGAVLHGPADERPERRPGEFGDLRADGASHAEPDEDLFDGLEHAERHAIELL